MPRDSAHRAAQYPLEDPPFLSLLHRGRPPAPPTASFLSARHYRRGIGSAAGGPYDDSSEVEVQIQLHSEGISTKRESKGRHGPQTCRRRPVRVFFVRVDERSLYRARLSEKGREGFALRFHPGRVWERVPVCPRRPLQGSGGNSIGNDLRTPEKRQLEDGNWLKIQRRPRRAGPQVRKVLPG